jgi:hypothetical protein
MKRLSIFILGGFGIGLVAILLSNTPSVSTEDQKLFKQQVFISIGTFPTEWDHVTFEEIGHRSIRLFLPYRNSPSSLDQVKNDMDRVARAVLKVLVDNGRNPQQEKIAVFVHGQVPERGESGVTLVRYFGKTMYDYNSGELIFKPAR